MKGKAGKTAAPTNPLDAFASADPQRVLQLVLWKARHQNPEMTVLITGEDLAAFDQCMAYQKINPHALIYRPEGRPASPGVPAAGTRRAIPPTAAEPPRPFVIVSLVERGTKNVVKPIENNEQDFKTGELVRQIQVVKRNIPDYVSSLRRAAASGDFSSATLEDTARALELWGRT